MIMMHSMLMILHMTIRIMIPHMPIMHMMLFILHNKNKYAYYASYDANINWHNNQKYASYDPTKYGEYA